MKKICTILIIGMLFAGVCVADEQIKNNKDDSVCVSTAELARVIMERRQEGLLITTLMTTTDNMDASESYKAALKQLIITAYKGHIWGTESHKSEAINEFSSKMYISCIEARK